MDRRPDLPTGTVTLLFTDIEGSTRLLQRLGDDYAGLLGEHHRVLREAIESTGGTVVGTEGDSVFAAFTSAHAAAAAAVAAQRALASTGWAGGEQVRVRMGLHTGEASVRDGNYVGMDVHRAARISAAAHGGQVVVSEAVRDLVAPGSPGISFRDLGRHRLKDLDRPERLFQLVADGLEAEFPPVRSLDSAPTNLPAQLTSFVGRDREVAEARRLLAGTRLLTLTGPGGTGKTRLSLRLAADAATDYSDGVFFVPLDPIEEAQMVAPAIVQALGLRESVSQPPAVRLAEHLESQCVLLVLDNFEQVLDASSLVGDLLRATRELRVLVTSRAPLHIAGEREYEVPPLGLPDPAGAADPVTLARSEAVALFVDRATAVRPDFALTTANAATVADICARLDGLPLAIELAAARVKLLPPQALLARLGQRLDVIESTAARDLPARQRTLRGAISWSYDLLDESARRLFARFSVFVDGADLETIEAVCGPDDPLTEQVEGARPPGEFSFDVLDGIAGLVDQSLVRRDEADGEPRFGMLFVIREYAMARLAEAAEAEAIAERHARYFLKLAEAAAPGLTGSDQKRLLDRLDRENGNLRAALNWSIERGRADLAMRLGYALWRFWQMRGRLQEGTGWLERILAVPGGEAFPLERAHALEAAGGVAYWRADVPLALQHYGAALEQCRAIGSKGEIANALYNYGFPMMVSMLDIPRAGELLSESLEIYRELHDRQMIARVLWGLGNTHYYGNEDDLAREVLEEDVALFRTLDDPFGLSWALHTLGLVYLRRGLNDMTEQAWREALTSFVAAGDVSGITLLLSDFGLLAANTGDIARALRLNAATERLARTAGTELASLFPEQGRGGHSQAGLIDPAEAQAAIEEGGRWTVEQAAEYALSG